MKTPGVLRLEGPMPLDIVKSSESNHLCPHFASILPKSNQFCQKKLVRDATASPGTICKSSLVHLKHKVSSLNMGPAFLALMALKTRLLFRPENLELHQKLIAGRQFFYGKNRKYQGCFFALQTLNL